MKMMQIGGYKLQSGKIASLLQDNLQLEIGLVI